MPSVYVPPLLCRLAIAPTLKVCAVPLMVAVIVPVALPGEVELFLHDNKANNRQQGNNNNLNFLIVFKFKVSFPFKR
jgi:hypothetical protein